MLEPIVWGRLFHTPWNITDLLSLYVSFLLRLLSATQKHLLFLKIRENENSNEVKATFKKYLIWWRKNFKMARHFPKKIFQQLKNALNSLRTWKPLLLVLLSRIYTRQLFGPIFEKLKGKSSKKSLQCNVFSDFEKILARFLLGFCLEILKILSRPTKLACVTSA